MEDWLVALKANPPVLFPLATFFLGIFVTVLGFLATRWTMTKKERKDEEQRQFENGRELMVAQHETSQAFEATIKRYIDKEGPPTLDDFMEIVKSGETYFFQQKIIGDAILSGRVDPRSRDNTLVPSLRDTVEKSLPAYYRSLRVIAKKKSFEFKGELKRENYESLYLAVEKYGKFERSVTP